MPKFVFQLEGVLRQRKHQEQECQREFALVQAEMAVLQSELKALDDSVQQSTEDMRRNRLTGALDMAFIAAHRRFTVGVQRRAAALVQKMALVQERLEEKQRALAEAAKRRKIVEKLRETQFERWKLELSRKEMNELDEIGAQLGYQNLALEH
jgi:flagellar FliJ protein